MNQSHWYQLVIVWCFCFLVPLTGWAQEQETAVETPGEGETDEQTFPAELPRQFREFVLGMNLDDLKTALQNDGMFNFRGDRDVSFLPAREESLVEISGTSYVKRAFFQLRDGALFIMAFTINTEKLDHYSVFTGLVGKYGEPSFLGPKEAVWETEDVRLAIERPLTIKYIDKKVFEDIVNESAVIQSRRVQERQDFLDEF